MLSHVLRTIRRHDLLVGQHGNRVLCAVSGGPDSMALLACLWELGPRLHLELEVATVDHGLRPEAAGEMSMVAARAADLGLPWHALRVDVAAARKSGAAGASDGAGAKLRGGVQEVARRLRLAALVELAERREMGRIALGHSADDQAETILFRILRGTGLKGLAGIPVRRGPLIRPLLDVTRAQILAYLKRRSLPFSTDPSNSDPHYARARLRHHILPLLRQENPRLDQALRGLAGHALRVMEAAPPGAKPGFETQFQTVPALVEMLRDGPHIPGRLVADIASAARDGRGTRFFDVGGVRRVTVSYGRVSVAPAGNRKRARGAEPPMNASAPGIARPQGNSAAHPIALPVVIRGPGSYPFAGGMQILVRDEAIPDPDHDGAAPDDFDWCWFDGDRLRWPLLARLRDPGDRMSPRGGIGSRKLADLLIDAKIPRPERASLPVVTTTEGTILFVPGLRPSQTASPSLPLAHAHAHALAPAGVPGLARRIGLAVVTKWDHDALVDRSILKGNTGRDPHPDRRPVEPDEGAGPRRYQRKPRPNVQTKVAVGTSQHDGRLDERKARAPGT